MNDNVAERLVNELVRWAEHLGGAAGGRRRTREAAEARAKLARLRRGLGKRPGEAIDAYAVVLPLLGDDLQEAERDDLFLVATLFAAHPQHAELGNLGATFWRMDHQPGAEPGGNERRLVALLNADEQTLKPRLRQAVRLAASRDVPIDYLLLARDVRRWRHADGREQVKRNWAEAYWRYQPTDTGSADASQTAGEQNS